MRASENKCQRPTVLTRVASLPPGAYPLQLQATVRVVFCFGLMAKFLAIIINLCLVFLSHARGQCVGDGRGYIPGGTSVPLGAYAPAD